MSVACCVCPYYVLFQCICRSAWLPTTAAHQEICSRELCIPYEEGNPGRVSSLTQWCQVSGSVCSSACSSACRSVCSSVSRSVCSSVSRSVCSSSCSSACTSVWSGTQCSALALPLLLRCTICQCCLSSYLKQFRTTLRYMCMCACTCARVCTCVYDICTE